MADQKKPIHLKLVVSNPDPVQTKPLYQTLDPNAGFTVEIHEKGESCYELVACDPSHRIDCEISLEIRDDEEALANFDKDLEYRIVACDFPNILADELNYLVEENETLYAMILVQFQMKVLEQILLFCSDHDATSLYVSTDTVTEGHALKVYEKLATHKDKVLATVGTITQLVIPTNQQAFDKLIYLMDGLNEDFQKALWRHQRTSPTIRSYLKSNLRLKAFG